MKTRVHVVLSSFHPGVDPATRAAMLQRCRGLGAACGGREAGILVWSAEWNLDQRKNYHMMEFALLRDAAAFASFRAHPAHAAFAAAMREVADWVVGDSEVEFDGALGRTGGFSS